LPPAPSGGRLREADKGPASWWARHRRRHGGDDQLLCHRSPRHGTVTRRAETRRLVPKASHNRAVRRGSGARPRRAVGPGRGRSRPRGAQQNRCGAELQKCNVGLVARCSLRIRSWEAIRSARPTKFLKAVRFRVVKNRTASWHLARAGLRCSGPILMVTSHTSSRGSFSVCRRERGTEPAWKGAPRCSSSMTSVEQRYSSNTLRCHRARVSVWWPYASDTRTGINRYGSTRLRVSGYHRKASGIADVADRHRRAEAAIPTCYLPSVTLWAGG
jgi:hypothetical protein